MGAPKVWIYHPVLDRTIEVRARRAERMADSGWIIRCDAAEVDTPDAKTSAEDAIDDDGDE